MIPVAPPWHAASQPRRAAGIGAVAFAVLVAVVVAALFLVLIGAHRSVQAPSLITTAPAPARPDRLNPAFRVRRPPEQRAACLRTPRSPTARLALTA